MNWNKCKLRKMPIVLLVICCLFGFIDSIQAQHVLIQSDQEKFVQPEIDYGAWNPVADLVDFSSEAKANKVRSIPSSPPERQFVPKTLNKNRNSNFRGDAVKNRRNFETTSPQDVEKKPDVSTFRPVYRKRTYSTSTTIATPTTTIKIESSRFKNYRKNTSDVVSAKPRRPYTPRTTSETILSTASEFPSSTKASPVKKVPPSRGNFRPKSADKDANDGKDDGEENYPEHFKQLLKNKEVNTQETDKNVIKKPVKPFRPTSTSERSTKAITNSSKPKSNVLFPTRQNRFLPRAQVTTTTSTSTESPSSSSQSVTVAPKRPLRTRSRPTERTRVNIGSTLQEPPTIKHSTPSYATRSPLAQESEAYEDRIITHADGLKQIDPPISEYIPRTNSIGLSSSALKYSSRFRTSDTASKNGREPSYQATVPTITTTPQLDLNDIDLDRWREILPLAAELIQNDAEIMTQSPSQTVSIYEALAEILSKPTESLSFLNNKSTESTLISEARFSSTTPSTTTTTTSTSTTKSTTTSTTTLPPSTSAASYDSSKVEKISSKEKFQLVDHDDDDNKISDLVVTTISVNNNTDDTATNVQATLTTIIPLIPSLKPNNKSIIHTTIIPTILDTTTASNTNSSFIDDNFSSNDTKTNEIPSSRDFNKFTKNETNGTNRIEIDQVAFSSTNFPSFTVVMLNSTQNSSTLTTVKSEIETKTTLPKLDLMTRKIRRKDEQEDIDIKTSSIFPVYKPVFRTESSTEPMKPLTSSTEKVEKIVTTTSVPEITTYSPKIKLTTLISNKAAPFTKVTPPALKITTGSTRLIKTLNFTTPRPKMTMSRMKNLTLTAATTKAYSTTLTSPTIPSKNPLNISLSEIIQFNKYLASPSKPNERVVYAVLSNNTVVRKIIREPKIVADQQIVYGILPNGTLVRKYRNGTLIRDDMSIEITNIDPKSLINAKNDTFKPQNNMRWLKSTTTTTNIYLPQTTTEMTTRTKMDNASLILDLLQKYQNETDTQVKSQNIFSLAKKTHHHELDLASENEVNKIHNDQIEGTIKPATTKITSTHGNNERPSTQSTIAAGKVSINYNGMDSSIIPSTTTTLELPKTTRDSFENEISFDELENEATVLKTSATLDPIHKTTAQVTRATTSVSSSISTFPRTTSTLPLSTTTTSSFIEETSKTFPTTTENYVKKNVEALAQLLNNPGNNKATTTSSTENYVEKNVKALEELLRNSGRTSPTTTDNYIENNVKALEELLGNSKKISTTENYIDKNVKALEELLRNPGIVNAASPTTEDYIGKNVKALEELLRNTGTTASPTTEDYVEKNVKALEELLRNTGRTTIPTTTTENYIEKNVKALEQLLTTQTLTTTSKNNVAKNIKALERLLGNRQSTQTITEIPTTVSISTTEIPLTTFILTTTTQRPQTTTTRVQSSSTTMRRKIPTQSTRHAEVISTMQPVKQTTAQQTTAQTTTTQSIATDAISTSTSIVPKTTHRFTPLQIPSDPPKESKKKSQFSDQDDLDFLRQLSKLINQGGTTTGKKVITTIPTTTTTTTLPTTTTTTTLPTTTPSTTTTIPTTTTKKATTSRLTTKYSDADDIAFLNSLRDYAGIINLTTERSALAQKILELALNRTSKSVDSKQSANSKLESMRPAPFTTTQSPEVVMNKIANTQKDINMMSAIIEENKNGNVQTKLSNEEIEKTKKMLQKDVAQYNKDIQLLSLLIGRPLTEKDVAKLAATNLGKTNTKPPPFSPLPQSTTQLLTTTSAQTSLSTSPIPAFKQLSDSEAKFLQALQQIQTTKTVSTTTTTTTTTPKPIVQARTRSQEAVIAELLKQQGIGPGNINQIPVDKLIEQLSRDNRLNRDLLLTPVATTTIRPFSPMPPRRQPRPIIDGLSWLWRTWQETGTGYQNSPPRQPSALPSFSQPQQTSSSNIDDLTFDEQPDSSSNNGYSNPSPLGPNGFLGAAIGVTRAVSRFLGVALTGAGQVLQGAFSGGSSASNPQGFGLFGSSRL